MGFISKAFAKKPVSTNQNFKMLNDIYEDPARQGVIGTNYLTGLLTGQGPDAVAAQEGLQNYYQQAGFQPALDAMTRGVTGSQAAAGLLRSGSTQKALLREGANLNNQFYQNYLSNLSGLADQGNNAGQILVGAGGGSSDSMRKGTAGILGSLIGKGLGLGLFSDRALKTDIVKVGSYPNGLPMYEFNYHGLPERWRGVMADDVEKKYPEAVGMRHGYKTVNYDMIGIRMERVDGSV